MLPGCEIRSSVSHASHGGIVLYCPWLIKTLTWRAAITQTAIFPPHLLTPAFRTAQNGDLRPITRNAWLIRRLLLFDFCRSKRFLLASDASVGAALKRHHIVQIKQLASHNSVNESRLKE